MADLRAAPSKTLEGWNAYRESRLGEAEQLWREAFAVDPYDREALRGLNRLKAERLVLPASEPYAQAVKDLYDAGMKAYRKDHWDEAEEALSRAAALLPGHQLIQTRLEEVRERSGTSAVKDPPVVLVPTHPLEETLVTPTLQSEPMPKPSGGKRSKPAAVRVDSAQVEGLYAEGMKAYRQKKYREALECWRKVVALDPGHAKARNNIKKLEGTVEGVKTDPKRVPGAQ